MSWVSPTIKQTFLLNDALCLIQISKKSDLLKKEGTFLGSGGCVLQCSQCLGCVAKADRRDYVLLSWSVLLSLSSYKAFCVSWKIIHIFVLGKFTKMSVFVFHFSVISINWKNNYERCNCWTILEVFSGHHSNSVVLFAQFVQLVSDPGHYLQETGWDGATNHRNSPENSQPLTEVRSLAACVFCFYLDFAFLV